MGREGQTPAHKAAMDGPTLLLLLSILTPARSNWLSTSGIVSGQVHGRVWDREPVDLGRDEGRNPGTPHISMSPLPGSYPGTEFELELCESQPYAMGPVSLGARDALVECQWQFKFERWNCTPRATPDTSPTDLFGPTLKSVIVANKEAAFISAITSAGIVHAVTKACSSGNLTECNCDNDPYSNRRFSLGGGSAGEKWTWGGCSDDIGYGIRFSRRFLDRAERSQHRDLANVTHLVHLHNNEVGRKTMESAMRRQCRCHGVSGGCDFKTCWLQMGKFTEVGAAIKDRYDRLAVMVTKRARKRLRRKERRDRKIPILPEELVYVAKSPNYCDPDPDHGIFGTRGRECNATSGPLGADACENLCCGRGFDRAQILRSEKCQCKFVWCCHVKCKTCTSLVDLTTCR